MAVEVAVDVKVDVGVTAYSPPPFSTPCTNAGARPPCYGARLLCALLRAQLRALRARVRGPLLC